jgi:hypothetical protein
MSRETANAVLACQDWVIEERRDAAMTEVWSTACRTRDLDSGWLQVAEEAPSIHSMAEGEGQDPIGSVATQ